ncbi:nucleoside hydrolase [Ewingella americana]|nr:nucleoside hydrolase [Ewingella americana]
MKLFVDCDTGIDDALALAYLAGNPQKVELLGIGSVCGNVSAQGGARNSINLLNLFGINNTPVAIGSSDYLDSKYKCVVGHIHGKNGIGDVSMADSESELVSLSAAELLITLAHKHPKEVSVLAIGPLTNLAVALQLEPELPDLIKSLIIMGGAAMAPGNVTAVAEANIAGDPHAADIVFRNYKNITLVPLDLTMSQTFEEQDIRKLLDSSSLSCQRLGQMLSKYTEFYQGIYGRKCAVLHDPVAAMIAVEGAFNCQTLHCDVVVDCTNGPGRGQTICDTRTIYNPINIDKTKPRIILGSKESFSKTLLETLLALP